MSTSSAATSASTAAKRREEAGESVKVVVRVRPISPAEKEQGFTNIIQVDRKLSAIRVTRPVDQGGAVDEPPRSFTFDHVYSAAFTQKQVFEETAQPIVDSVLSGYNGTIFAYGQTGTGKTFTMEGIASDPNLRGIMPNSFEYVFAAVQAAPKNVEFLVRASFLEIYLDEVYDLLAKDEVRKKMDLKMNKDQTVYVKDLVSETVKSPADLYALLAEGQKQRRVGATAMNKGSSRSHSIFTVVVESSIADETTGARTYKQGKLNLVDLAGSERQKKTHAEGERLEEAKNINWSLSVLGNVIKALASPNPGHVPFRDSKLTRLLQDSLGGNTKTCMIANIGPVNSNWSETMSTLRYADRAKSIKNKPKINEDPKDAQLRTMQEEIAMLKAKLLAKQRGIDLSKLTHEQAVTLGQTGALPEGVSAGSVEEREIVRVRIVDTGYRVEDLQRILQSAEQEAAEMTNKTEAERTVILQKKKDAEMKLHQLESELKAKAEAEHAEKEEAARVAKMLKEKQEELVHGGGHVEQAVVQKRALAETETELQRRRDEQALLERELNEKEEARLMMDEQYMSTEQAIAATHETITALFTKWKMKQEEIKHQQDEFDEEREDIFEAIRDLDKQIKLRSVMIESFMPESFYRKVFAARHWDPDTETWLLPGLELSGNNVNRPELTDHEGSAVEELHARYVLAGCPSSPEEAFEHYSLDGR